MLSHDVFFTLNDNSPEACQKLVDACRKYLTNHPGIEFFSAGLLCPDLKRPVNDHAFDVALHVTFDSRENHDLYQEAADHIAFIEENKPNWKNVRVFDSNVTGR